MSPIWKNYMQILWDKTDPVVSGPLKEMNNKRILMIAY